MNDQKPPVRSVRTPAPPPARPYTQQDVETFPTQWSRVINGVVQLDINAAHEKLEKDLRLGDEQRLTGSGVISALDEVATNVLLASKLKNKARREYELYKDAHAAWLEEKKTVALKELTREKESGEIKKQITIDMIEDRVRAVWPDEYRDHKRQLADFQAAVHTLEDLASAWTQRARTLSDVKDLVMAMGAATATPYQPRKREGG